MRRGTVYPSLIFAQRPSVWRAAIGVDFVFGGFETMFKR